MYHCSSCCLHRRRIINGDLSPMPSEKLHKKNEAEIIRSELQSLSDPAKARVLARFFKTGPGDYGEGDRFHGVVVPKIRSVVKAHRKAAGREVRKLLCSQFHEERLTALLILVGQYQRGEEAQKKRFSISIWLIHPK